MPEYNEQQSRFDKAFHVHRTITVMDCDCGRVHFVAGPEHGDYEEGELEGLLEKASEQPDKYVPEYNFGNIDQACIDGRFIVPDCPCGKYKQYCDWIESHADELAIYLREYLNARIENAKRITANTSALLTGLMP